MKPRCIVFDCDEVLLDHMGMLSEFVKQTYNITPSTPYPLEYDLSDWLGVPQPEVKKILEQFNQQSYLFGLLKPVEPNTVDIVQELRDRFHKEKFVVLTKCGKKGYGEVLRNVNLMREFGENCFDEIIIIEMNESKKEALEDLQTQYDVKLMIDDYINNIETAMGLGIPSVMMGCSHNTMYKNHSGFEYIENWTELRLKIYSVLGKYYK
ncbi:hypothetical protein G3565_04345 [Escherichia coli]|nr:hypothetical protein [Escherichia coli]